MKKISFLSLISIILLSSCTSDVTSTSPIEDSNTSSITTDTNTSLNTSDSGSTTITDTSTDTSSSSFDSREIKQFTLNSSNYSFGKYNTGNSGDEFKNQFYVSDYIRFSYYLALNSSDGFIDLLPYIYSENDGTIPGSFMNYDQIEDIEHIEITYTTNTSSIGDALKIEYGDNVPFKNSYTASNCVNFETVSFPLNNADYFRIEAVSDLLTIKSIDIYYRGELDNGISINKEDVNKNEFRISPIKYNGNLISGVSTVQIPTEIKQNGNEYEVVSYKTLTYYSSSDFINGKYDAETVSVTDPFDVASYVMAFGEDPLNYNNSYKSLFGSLYRKKSKLYTRDDGYVNAIPNLSNTNNFYSLGYYEYDIALEDSNYGSSRGTGRVVIFNAGLNEDGYGSDLYAVYTDDHYATFQEYLGYKFSNRFDSQTTRTGYKWSLPTTISLN